MNNDLWLMRVGFVIFIGIMAVAVLASRDADYLQRENIKLRRENIELRAKCGAELGTR